GAIRKAIALLRGGRAVGIGGSTPIAVLSVETGTQELLDLLDPAHEAQLLISGERAAALNLANDRNAADPAAPVILASAPWLDAAAALAIADPGKDLDRAPLGPLQPVDFEAVEAARAALDLARSSGLLPALWLLKRDATDFSLAIDDIETERRQPSVEIV